MKRGRLKQARTVLSWDFLPFISLLHITTEFGQQFRANVNGDSERIRTPESLVFFFPKNIIEQVFC